MGLHCRTVNDDCPFDVSGFTFAGMPGVVIGHNRDIAWGMTNLDADVTDLYLEKITGKTYLYAGRQAAAGRARRGDPRSPGSEPELITVRVDRATGRCSPTCRRSSPASGPTRDVPAGAPDREQRLCRRALLDRADAPADRRRDLRVQHGVDWTEFREAARWFAVPSQNLVYADTDGNIGYQAPGAIPIRRGNRAGDYPAAGWVPQNDWTGRYVPFDDAARACSTRRRASSSSANQAVTGPDYPYHLERLPGTTATAASGSAT